ncbi:hypothetical protein N9089_03870 [Crocinitomicaceae bacterium]|nr:hypothetical protein [Crocinitomicaceae bacterium]
MARQGKVQPDPTKENKASKMLINRRHQHAVGQGFFHSAVIEGQHHKPCMHYVYDCGSTDREALTREIDGYVEMLNGASVELLFVSHMDHDHVCGLDQLLLNATVNCSILPYLTPIERLTLIAEALDKGNFDGNSFHFLCDPTDWLRERGIRRIIYVMPNDNRREVELAEEADLPQAVHDLTLDFQALRDHPDVVRTDEGGVEVFRIPCSIPLNLLSGQGVLNWTFLMFTFREGERGSLFRQRVRETFGEDLAPDEPFEINRRALLGILQNPRRRRELADCYNVVRRNRNLTSLSLYSGPHSRRGSQSYMQTTPGRYEYRPGPVLTTGPVCGWLGTGDSNLSATNRRTAFFTHFATVLNSVSTFALPHHGARANFHPDLVRSNRQFFVAAVGENNPYGHPHPEVCQAVYDLRSSPPDEWDIRYLVITNENPQSRFLETIRLSRQRAT